MRLDFKKKAGLLALSAGIVIAGVAEARRGQAEKIRVPGVSAPDSQPRIPMPSTPEPSQAVIVYDDVGYAGIYPDHLAGLPMASGEPYNPRGYSAAHPTLPLNTFAEVTNLDTGMTILVRINDLGPSARGRLVDLSAAAAQALGLNGNGGGTIPVRVRRVNPPEQEKAALINGQKAADRLATPQQLLTALRKKLGAGAAAPAPVTQAGRATAPIPNSGTSYGAPTADNDGFVVEEQGAWGRAPSTAPVQAAKAVKPRPAPAGRPGTTYEAPVVGKDGFIVEQAGRPSAVAPTHAAAQNDAGYYVQVAAFSDEGRARNAAGKVRGGVTRAGNVWRVRTGPFANQALARTALGHVAANGYRDARITR
jgi:rare lipoprotein A